jgi:hypothetical protein
MKKVFITSILMASLTAFAQKAPTTLNFPKGQKLEMVTEVKKTTTMDLMGQSMETNGNATITQLFDVENVTDEGAVIEHKIKRLMFASSGGMGGDQTFDSEKEGDRNGQLGKILEKTIKNKFKMTIDQKGKVVAVKADDDNPNAKKDEQAEAIASMISSQMGFSVGVPKVGANSQFKVLPDRQVKINDTWKDSSNLDGIKTITRYTVKSISEREVVLDFNEEVNVKSTQNIMGNEATIIANDTSTGQITIDANTGLLKQKTSTSDSKGSIEAQGMSIPMNSKTTTTIRVTQL